MAFTASGAGSILGLAAQMTMSHLAEAGSLLLRALPVLLLTFLVFFNSPVWLMASTVSRSRLWLAIAFLSAIAVAFVVSVTVDRVQPMIDTRNPTGERAARLAGTPFATDAGAVGDQGAQPHRALQRVSSALAAIPARAHPGGRRLTALIFFILGLILLSPELLAAWTRNGSSDGTLLGMTIPVPDALIQITLFLGALTLMYISARAVG